MKSFILKLSLIVLIFFSACKKKNVAEDVAPTPPAPPLAAQSTNDVAYGTDALQKFDMVLPAGRTETATKVLIIIHGGAWTAGDKADMTTYLNTLKTSLPDYAFFNINYRLANAASGANPFPTQENDVKAAINFIYNNRSTYKISDKIALLGASAGAHLALLQAYKNATPKIKAVVDLYGPTDMTDMYNNPAPSSPAFAVGYLVTGTLGGSPTSNAAAFTNSSPITYVSTQSPPTILFHGTADVVVKVQQSTALVAKLSQNNVFNQYVPYTGEGHAYTGASLNDTFLKSVAFLNTYVQ